MKNPTDALRDLANRLSVVDVESMVDDCTDRVLASDIVADRDSPAADVSAMDGYAIRLADLSRTEQIAVSGESAPGAPPPEIHVDSVVRIFTGAIVPTDCDAVVKREETEELDEAIRFLDVARKVQNGENIRRAGENAAAGSTVLKAGVRLTAAHRATMANFGAFAADVYAPVRITLITTGDEVGQFDRESPQPWELRNSNQSSIKALLSRSRWIQSVDTLHARDNRDDLQSTVASALEKSDAVLLTGGVSMGDYDYVPDVVRSVGGEIVFHGLPVRPGKPILGGATADGKLILGLPGNPVSATIGCHRFGLPLLAKKSGQTDWLLPCPTVRLDNPGDKTIPLHWMRLVRLIRQGVAQPVLSQGSGDLVSLGQSTGYVELPPGQSGEGPWPYYIWP
ncbi:MAG: molybdopterin molybdotransferase MoeA [Pirellulaceae bacterium]|nr:molybdopterin molybdotransferase MoeA [Pirellulaceae bacterium]